MNIVLRGSILGVILNHPEFCCRNKNKSKRI